MADLLKFTRTSLTGGGATAVDGISVTALVGEELCWAIVSDVEYLYRMNATSGAAADGVNIIIPVVGTVGNKRWILQSKKTGSGNVVTDHILESTAAHGVDVDGVVLKDGDVNGTVGAATPKTGAFTTATASTAIADNTSTTQLATTAFARNQDALEAAKSSGSLAENVQYPLPASGYMLKAAADGSSAQATNTDTDVADAVTKKHTQNTDTGTTATSWKINSSGNEADLQTTGLTGDRDFTMPDIDTMLTGAVTTAENGAELINFTTAALETQLTSITHTAPGAPDYAIQDLIDSGVGSAFGFASKDEGNTVLKVILNLQTRMAALETELKATKLLA